MRLMEKKKVCLPFELRVYAERRANKKAHARFAAFLSSESFPANSSEESSFPSGAKMQSQLPFGTFARMISASFANPCKICVSFDSPAAEPPAIPGA